MKYCANKKIKNKKLLQQYNKKILKFSSVHTSVHTVAQILHIAAHKTPGQNSSNNNTYITI